jgi:hypothetical protein
MTDPGADGDREAEAADEVPTHRRTIDVEVFERQGDFVVVGRLADDRPWAAGSDRVEHVHDMELSVTVRRPDLVITEARAVMRRFPHAECPGIEAAFGGLVGLSVARGYTRAVQERFGRALGCTHLEFLARAIGPVVVQALPSSAARTRAGVLAEPTRAETGTAWLADTCHVWAVGGAGEQKLALGWRPGNGPYPAPSLVELRRPAAPD